MLSRHADALFWLARYVERAEQLARLLDVTYHGYLEDTALQPSADAQWTPVLTIVDEVEKFHQTVAEFTTDSVVQYLTFGDQCDTSILKCLDLARQNARSVRELISSEMWEELNMFYLFLRDAKSRPLVNDGHPYGFFREVRNRSHLFQGITDSTMGRDEGWQFIQAGRSLERAYQTTRLVDVKYYILLPDGPAAVGGPVDLHQWISVLKSCSAYEAFRRKYASQLSPGRVVELLVLDQDFPRSVFFSVQRLEDALKQISGSVDSLLPATHAERYTQELRQRLQQCKVADIIQFGLHEYLVDMADQIWQIGDAINAHYFA